MNFAFRDHYQLVGKHAFLSASKYSWIRYTDEKLIETYGNHQQATLGSRLHEFAKEAILMGIKLPKTTKTLNQYVNDAIGYRMVPEQVLYYSENVFGTADAILFKPSKRDEPPLLRIHDLKNGVNKASLDQLKVYVAIFCLEYTVDPAKIDIELRIYQNDEVIVDEPDLEQILDIMERIVRFDNMIEEMKAAADL